MMAAPRDSLYLEHIAERIPKASGIEDAAQEGCDAFEASHVLQGAVIRNFEVIGVAVKQLSSGWAYCYVNSLLRELGPPETNRELARAPLARV